MFGENFLYEQAGKSIKFQFETDVIINTTYSTSDRATSHRPTFSRKSTQCLGTLCRGKFATAEGGKLLNKAQAIPDNTIELTTSESVNGHTWHLTTVEDEGHTPEEVVFTLHGIIMQCDLPPIIRPYGRFVSPKHLQQRVLLTGLNTTTFSHGMDGLTRLDSLLRQAIRDVHPKPIPGLTEGHTTVDIANRYFTSKRVANEEHHVGFPKNVDPKGILDDIRGDAFVYTADNVVEYYQRQVVNDIQRFKPIHPSHINKGDIVEIQLTLNLVEHASGKGRNTNIQYITKLILRSITLLDKTFSEASLDGISNTVMFNIF
ncbi:hypothetical protein VNI00_013137 [Paramarasmius palmivorus]|uniref:Uncharacterized protein n=1 Tax=Paramarasmius palmivorus TaxID=297713 RepID=A0AAW0BZN3_9AGAR